MGNMTAEELIAKINATLENPKGVVVVSSMTRATAFKSKHRDMFKLSKSGKSVLAQFGRQWLDIMGCKIQFGYVTK